MKHVEIYTDGACRGNPGPGGWGALLRHGAREREISGGESDTTNNRMELTAAIRALEALSERCSVDLYTDSVYVRSGSHAVAAGVAGTGLAHGEPQPVKNQDLWRRLAELVQAHEIDWHWVKGHAGHPENDAPTRWPTGGWKCRNASAMAHDPSGKERRQGNAMSTRPDRAGHGRRRDSSPEAGHRIIEIGGVELVNRRPTHKTFHRYLNPERVVEAGALEVHGIDNDFLEDKPRFAEVVDEFIEFVDGAELVIHNADFDIAFLNHELARLDGGSHEFARVVGCSTRWPWLAACIRASATAWMRSPSGTRSTTPRASFMCAARRPYPGRGLSGHDGWAGQPVARRAGGHRASRRARDRAARSVAAPG